MVVMLNSMWCMFVFKQKTAYDMRISDWSSYVCSSDLGKYHDALTSFRLALRDDPQDPTVLQQVAMAYTRIGMTEQAAKTYRMVLERKPRSAGDRKSDGQGKGGPVRVDPGGRRIIKKNKSLHNRYHTTT